MRVRRNTKGLLRGAPIGNKGGPGRPPNWLMDKCKKIVEKNKLIEFLGDVAAGKKVDIRYNALDDKEVASSATIKDRLHASELLIERGWGRAVQTIDTNLHANFLSVDPETIKFLEEKLRNQSVK